MQNKSHLDINVGEHYRHSTNSQPANEFSIENVPIHSMKKDLEMIAHPETASQEFSSLPASPNSSSASSSKISPFLEKTNPAPDASVSQKKFENIADKPLIERSLELEAPDPSPKNTLRKVFVFSIIFLSLIALGIGSYYFWLIRVKISDPAVPESQAITPVEEPSLLVAVVEPAIKKESPRENTLVLDLENSTAVKIKMEIKSQIEKLPKESFAKPVEFKLRDSQNNLLDFSLFAKKSGITFAQNLSAYLGEPFSLLVFNDGPNMGTGLIIKSKNDSLLAQEMLKEENYLPKDLNILFLTAAPKLTKKISFSSFTNKDISLRYFNLVSPEKLSIDYAVAKNKLIIGTTRNTLLALYDWLLLKSDTP